MTDHASSVLFQNARVIDPVNNIDGKKDVLIENGVITAIEEEILPSTLFAPPECIDLNGKWLMPGFIDMHVHLREPGEEYKETIASGTKAAAAGGFTAVACMPNTTPVNDSATVTSLILEQAHQAATRVYPVAAISQDSQGENLAEFGELSAAGAVAVSDDGLPVEKSQLMRRAMEYASRYGLQVITHAEDIGLSKNGVMNEGEVSTRLGLTGIPRPAEDIMVYRDISLACYTGLAIHIAHVSTKESVHLIRWAKANGCQVTAETAPHYFSLTEDVVGLYDCNAKMNPPLRTSEDVKAIKAGLADGTIDAIATDHAPHSPLEKEIEFDQAANGIIGLETAIPLALELLRDRTINESKMIELFSVNPARILGVEGGSLSIGAKADITVVDPEKEFQYTLDSVVSKSKNSPFLDRKFTGKAVITMVDGKISYSELG